MKLFALALAALLASSTTGADDGLLFRKNVSRTPDLETEHTIIKMMGTYIPAQAADGDLTPVDYYKADGLLYDTRDNAKPLVMFYTDGTVEHVPDLGFSGHGRRDIFASVSLDDGNTWKKINLSQSADQSSITLGTGRNKVKYPGDVIQIAATIAGDRAFAAWASRYCESGDPAYTQFNEDDELTDLFGVLGSQGYSDFADEGYPEVGLVPYACLWTARGVLEETDDDGYQVVWRKAERVTSGVRDVNRVAVAGLKDVGFVATWQEDPDGLRPGQGLGPGEGWSGAIAHQQTDIWYSYIGWDDFALTGDEELEADAAPGSNRPPHAGEDPIPTVAVRMALPVRLTDNGMCKYGVEEDEPGYHPYCYVDFNGNGTPDLCAEEVQWTQPGGVTLDLCKTEDGRVLWGRNAATRAVVNLRPYTNNDDEKSAWMILAYEETKALGDGADSEDIEPIDIGKTVKYHSFDMFNPNLVAQGLMLNAPARDPETGNLFEEEIYDDWGNRYYETEIARRASLLTQPAEKAGDSGLVAFPLFKQGIINQGGPSDIMARRFLIPETFDPAVDNPYAPANMECLEWTYTDGSNPIYLEGLCMNPANNLSSTGIVSCDNGTSGETCAAAFPWEGGEQDFPKVTRWLQTEENLGDESWTNPYDVAKGHRGYLDGDFIMMMYAWSPNWKANTIGQDHYNLYARRSFDGGLTWTTTPATLGGDGTTHTENYLDGTSEEITYEPGEFEQARNLSQLTGMNLTVLDPRFARTPEDIKTDGGFLYEDDQRDDSRYFVVYETGDNSTTAEGEPTPLDLFYSRAANYGDDYEYVEVIKDGEIVEVWDWIENSQIYHASEASVLANPGGTFFYAGWNQWQEDAQENVYDSDAWVRRIMYIDQEVTP